jgi:hypothetical protein
MLRIHNNNDMLHIYTTIYLLSYYQFNLFVTFCKQGSNGSSVNRSILLTLYNEL